jgi:hypothetical protein
MAEALSRKKKVRAAHRASVTRMISQSKEMLDSGEELNAAKLKQKRQALQQKSELLLKLDAEIVEIIEEDGLDEEIEQADIVRERIELAIVDLDSALDAAATKTREPSATHTATSTAAGGGAGGPTDAPPDPIPPPDDGTGTGHGSHGTTPTSSPAATPSHSRATSPTHSRTSTPPLELTSTGGSPAHSTRVKLPKLSLKKFNGDLTKWITFWDTFDSAVHRNSALSSIDKFNYLNSLLESAAAEAIAGLTLTSANYEEAVATLKRRFGNKQLIVNRHMDLLLNLEAVASQHNLKGLRQLFDVVESNIRGLRALGVPASSYGGLLSSILISKLPAELRLIVSRELNESDWNLETMMQIFRREVEARERSAGASPLSLQPRRSSAAKSPPTAMSLMAGASMQVSCAYCNNAHSSSSCQTVTDPEQRKRILRTTGRCFICLKRHHISRNCRSSARCNNCRGRHHSSICATFRTRTDATASPSGASIRDPPSSNQGVYVPTTTALVGSHTPILLQTAKVTVCGAGLGPTLEVRAILDPGSQRSYVTSRAREVLQLKRVRSESMSIKTFGSTTGDRQVRDVVQLKVLTKNSDPLILATVVVPHICDPIRAPPITATGAHEHLNGLELADSDYLGGELEIDVLVGSDHYWEVVTGRIIRGTSGPAAVETKLGWVLSGPVEGIAQETTAINFVSTHSLRVDAFTEQQSLEEGLKRFWELESLGILKDEQSVYDTFTQQISFKQGRYEVHLPWKESHPLLPDNYELCRKRLNGLLRKLNQDPGQLRQYDAVIRDQLRQGVVEVVSDPTIFEEGRVHYLPHHAVVRHDKQTTKLRVVYDASAKADGPSLNDCLYTGPNFGQSILDILLRFRLHRVALVGDVEKAFLMVSVADCDRDVLRFLWIKDVREPQPEVTIMRFTRVVFGVSASPFLLNATIDHHIKKYSTLDQPFVSKFRRSIYVDDLTAGSHDADSAYEFYVKSKLRLAEANFNLRKFDTNSPKLRQRIESNEQLLSQGDQTERVQTRPNLSERERQVLGVRWDVTNDVFVFDVSSIADLMKETRPTKRNAVSLATRFFDPLGVITPLTIRFKLLFQQLCETKVGWDEPLEGRLLTEWEALASDLQRASPISIPRCCTEGEDTTVKSYSLDGFCDASLKAYAAVIYLRVETETNTYSHLLCSKTRVAPLKKVTIPRLELLSALLLARLISTITNVLEPEIELIEPTCHTDSQVALCWIKGVDKEWKQFVQNRVLEIRKLVPVTQWRHCPGTKNPADIPSRGASTSELSEKLELWLNGPSTIEPASELIESEDTGLSDDCLAELKAGNREKVTANLLSCNDTGMAISCQDYSNLRRLLRVTAYVFKFIKLLRRSKVPDAQQSSSNGEILTTSDINAALVYWLRQSQSALPQSQSFHIWSIQFGLFMDHDGLWRCGGRLENAGVPQAAKHPIFLPKNHHLTELIVSECHKRVMHGGVSATLTELRSKYWVVKGRQLVKKILHKCVICRRYQGKHYCPPPPPFRVNEARPFSYTGVDFAGPLYVKDTAASPSRKVWICLYTCCVTRAVHLDIVPDMTSQAFLRSFKRFTSRRSFPVRILSDNAKTFKAAAKTIAATMESPEVKQYFADVNVDWSFNLEKAPWWGGIFERMIQTTKRCLRKTIGSARLTYDELLTSVTEVEMILNSRPLTYLSSDDAEEPLTPSHLLLGYRVLSLPDTVETTGEEYTVKPTRDNLTRRMQHLNKTIDHFWRRWRSEYLLELRESHRHPGLAKGVTRSIAIGDIVIIHDDAHPRGLWKLGKVENLITGVDGHVRGAAVRVLSSGQNTTILKRPVQRLYPLEVQAEGGLTSPLPQDTPRLTSADGENPIDLSEGNTPAELVPQGNVRQRRKAFIRAQGNLKQWVDQLNMH